jgi:3-oxoacyl-[acyl-carrier-protein] synthase II
MTTRVVVTGLGIVCPAGVGVADVWTALREGRSCVAPLRRFDARSFPTRIAAVVPEDETRRLAEAPGWRERGRIAWYAADAVRQAWRASGAADRLIDRTRAGIVFASGLGTYEHDEVFPACAAATTGDEVDWQIFARVAVARRAPRAHVRRQPGHLAADLARQCRIRGPVAAPMTACAGGTHAIGQALRDLQDGRADLMVAGASDSEIYPMGLASFCRLGALSTRNDDPATASRPFDRHRDGFVLGEGAAVLVLETLAHARTTGAPILAEVLGFGAAADAFRTTDPHPDGRGAVAAMRAALADARIDASSVSYVNAHGTSTQANDRVETLALKAVLGERVGQVPVSSTKSMIGHATVAAGAIEAAATVLMIGAQCVHPTTNLSVPDPECDLDYVTEGARAVSLQVALSNSFAFGGQTACLAIGAPDR